MRPTPAAWLLVLAFVASASQQQADAQDLGGARKPQPQMTLKRGDSQYKRIHQFALRLMLLNRDQEMQAFVEDHLSRHPEDPESHYMLGLLAAKKDAADEAAEWMEKAIELGLPTQRIVAGPRSLLTGVKNHPFFRQQVERFANAPIHGPLVGNVTATSASIWVRTAKASRVVILASEKEDLSDPIRSAAVTTSGASDFTGVASLVGLKSQTRYYYGVSIDDQPPQGMHARSYFHTFAPTGAKTKFTLAFGGGAGYVPPHERMWNTIQSHRPDVLLLLGDNVYIDDPESLEMNQYTYQRRQSRPEYRALTAHTPVFCIWDDHDFGTNDCWGGPLVDTPAWKRTIAYKTFTENWANPAYGGGPSQPGCWYSFSIGDVDFIMLDCRYYRTSPRLDAPSMLGPVQMKWLKEQLSNASGTFKVICSSVPWDFRTKGDSRDTWNGFKAEREEVFSFIEQQDIEGVVLMSADRHRSDAWRIERPNGYDFYEFNSSRLTNQHVHPTMEKKGAIFSYNAKQSFGLVQFDTLASDPHVIYQVFSIDNEPIAKLTVRRSELQ